MAKIVVAFGMIALSLAVLVGEVAFVYLCPHIPDVLDLPLFVVGIIMFLVLLGYIGCLGNLLDPNKE